MSKPTVKEQKLQARIDEMESLYEQVKDSRILHPETIVAVIEKRITQLRTRQVKEDRDG